MDNWKEIVEQLARQFHDSASNVLDTVEADCQRHEIQFNDDFIELFFGLLDEK